MYKDGNVPDAPSSKHVQDRKSSQNPPRVSRFYPCVCSRGIPVTRGEEEKKRTESNPDSFF